MQRIRERTCVIAAAEVHSMYGYLPYRRLWVTAQLRKSERLEARLEPEQKALLVRAAALRGLSLTDFVLQAAQEAAATTVRQHDVLALSLADSEALADALLAPEEPAAAPRRAAARHAEILGR